MKTGKDSLANKTTGEFFSKKFQQGLELWKDTHKGADGKRGTEKAFAQAIFASQNSITAYKRGTIPTDETVKEICREFNVDETYFIPQTEKEKYRYSIEYIGELGEERDEYAKNIGLDSSFIDFLFKHYQFTQNDMYLPLSQNNSLFSMDDYIRCVPAQTEVSSLKSKYIISDNETGKNFILSRIDLKIMRELQEELEKCIEFFYWKRRKKWENELKKANDDCVKKTADGVTTICQLTPEQLAKIDTDGGSYVYLGTEEDSENGEH